MIDKEGVEPVVVRIAEDQVKKIYAQPKKDRSYMINAIYDEMLFFLKKFGSIERNHDKLPRVYFSKEEQARIDGIHFERMLGELEIICGFDGGYYLMRSDAKTV